MEKVSVTVIIAQLSPTDNEKRAVFLRKLLESSREGFFLIREKTVAAVPGQWYNNTIKRNNCIRPSRLSGAIFWKEFVMFQCKLVSSMTKVFADQEPREEHLPISILRGETASCQVALQAMGLVRVTARAPGFRVSLRQVSQVPVRYACDPTVEDDNYLRKAPGLYPDVLIPLPEDGLVKTVGWWKSVWIDAEPEPDTQSGTYPLSVQISQVEGDSETVLYTEEQPIQFVNVPLPPQKLIHTEWFHADCLSNFYNVEPLSESHWEIMENFIRSAARMGINMILTPIFTPPLDTQVGRERTTVQLIEVQRQDGVYTFDFRKLKRWVEMCRRCGIEYFEMAHLYSQWGTNRAPKIMATDNGTYRRIFGWETDATAGEYGKFLAVFLPQLVEELKKLGIADKCRFHIMDEPHSSKMSCYLAEKQQVSPYLQGIPTMDALSDFEFYSHRVVEHPIVASSSPDVVKFLTAGVPDLWLYYCCAQGKDVSNRFISMPTSRTRILGVQLYRYRIAGFLQWGFNFYNAQLSVRSINPYSMTDSDEGFPSGDGFIVYPGRDGRVVESIRYMAIRQAMHDLRALELLESLTDRQTVEQLIQEDLTETLTLTNYPHENGYLPTLRSRVNMAIAAKAEQIGTSEDCKA